MKHSSPPADARTVNGTQTAALVLMLIGAPITTVAAQPERIPPIEGKIQKSYGIRFIEITTGTGPTVAQKKCVYAHYTGWLKDGTKFESSRDVPVDGSPSAPVAFVLGVRHVMEGWDIGFREGNMWHGSGDDFPTVTHWLPLPPDPE